MKICTVEFNLNSSHDTNEIGFFSCCEYKIIDNGMEYSKYIPELIIQDDTTEEFVKNEFERIAKIGSVALAKKERNPFDACPYFTIDWKTFKYRRIRNKSQKIKEMGFLDNMKIEDHLSMKITRNIQLKEIQEFVNCKENYSFDIELFYHGLMSNNNKSKFFHFFSILENLENSKDYLNYFNKNLLFSIEEISNIRKFAGSFDIRKKEIICKNLTATKLTRIDKLFSYLQKMNLECIQNGKVTIIDIKNIISQRNKLYHSSECFDTGLVYDKLFPLVREMVIRQLLLEKSE